MGITKLTEQAFETHAQRTAIFHENESKIIHEIEEAKKGLDHKSSVIKKEEKLIKQLHQKLESLEAEKKQLESEIGDLTMHYKNINQAGELANL